MQKEFLIFFFSISKLDALRCAITSFSQEKNEQLHESWDKSKKLWTCPHYTMRFCSGNSFKFFYFGLDEHNGQMVDASCGGNFLYKTPEEA